MRVLVTGCNGFTGRYLVQELEMSGYEVYGIGSKLIPSHKLFRVDLLDSEALRDVIATIKPEMVFHLAGVAFVATKDASLIYKTNVIGTYNLLSSLEESECAKEGVLLTSSANVYGANAQDKVREDVIPKPVSHYGISKLAMEKMANLFDIPTVIARPFNYTGIGQSEQFLIPKIVKAFKKREAKLELGNLNVSREFGDVREVVQIYRKLLEQQKRNFTVNVCTGKPYSIGDILKKCIQITKHTPSVYINPSFKRENEISCLYGDSEKLSQIIDLSKRRNSIDDLLSWMLKP